jgi:hypothetical protein
MRRSEEIRPQPILSSWDVLRERQRAKKSQTGLSARLAWELADGALRRSTDIARVDKSMIRSDAPVGRYGLTEGLPAQLRCISNFDVFQSSMEDSRVLRTHVMETATLLGRFPGWSLAQFPSRHVVLHSISSTPMLYRALCYVTGADGQS